MAKKKINVKKSMRATADNLKKFLTMTFVILLAVLLAGYLLTSALLKQFNPVKWTLPGTNAEQSNTDKDSTDREEDKPGASEDKEKDPGTDTPTTPTTPNIEQAVDLDGGLLAPSEYENRGVTFNASAIPVEFYDDYDVSEEVESAFTLTVVTNPDVDPGGAFYVKFANENSDWAITEYADDYIKCEQINSKSATITCLAPFGEQVIVVYYYAVESFGELLWQNAEYPLDYMQRIESVSVSVEDVIELSTTGAAPQYSSTAPYAENVVNLSALQALSKSRMALNFDGFIKLGVGTVKDTFAIENITLDFTEAFKDICRTNNCIIPESSVTFKSTFIEDDSENNFVLISGTADIFTALFGENFLDAYITQNMLNAFIQLKQANETSPVGALILSFDFVGERSTFSGEILFGIDFTGYQAAPDDSTVVEFPDEGHIF